MKNKNFETWEEVRKELNITPDQEIQIQLETKRIENTIKNREK